MTKLKALGLGAIAILCIGTGFAASPGDIQACMTANQDIIANSQDAMSVRIAKSNVAGGCTNTVATAAMWQCIDQQVVQNGVTATTATQNCTNQMQ